MVVLSILQVALGIGLLIFIHELGHFLAARLAGVRVEVFSLGFGARILGCHWRGTDYRLSLVPLGGYVRVAGEDPTYRVDLADDDLHAKGFGARALFFSGGVLMNLAFAAVAFPIVFKQGVDFPAPVIGEVTPGGAAWRAGLEPGDRVLAVDGKEMYSFDNLRVEHALAAGRPVHNLIERDGETFGVTVEAQYSTRIGLFDYGAYPALAPKPMAVEDVAGDGPAARAGLRARDRLVAIDGERIVGEQALEALRQIQDDAPGRRVTLTVERDGAEQLVEFETGSRESEVARVGVRQAQNEVLAVRPEVARLLDLAVGDIVVSTDGRIFRDAEDFERSREGEAVLVVQVRRSGTPVTLSANVSPADRATIVDGVAFTGRTQPVEVVPTPGSPANAAGVLAGDVLISVDDRPVEGWEDLIEAVRDAGESPMQFVFDRNDTTIAVSIAPRRDIVTDLGFVPAPERLQQLYRKDSVGEAIEAGFVASVDLVKQLYVTLKRLFTGDVAASNLGGIVTISRVSYHYAKNGWAEFLYFLALLSINLAFINVLPIPVLDGGHLMFLLIERIKGSPVSTRVMNYSQVLGLVFVIALMVFVTYNDILKLL